MDSPYIEDGPIWNAIDIGGGQTCDIAGVLRELTSAGYVIVKAEPKTVSLLGRLDAVAALKPNDSPPEWLPPNGWGSAISELCREAAAEIRMKLSKRP
jgi:hypothetical protein